MKILQINANYGYGSTGLIMRDIGDAITNSGNEALYAYQRCLESPQNGIVVGNILDWKLHAVASRIFGHQGFYSKVATMNFLKTMDVVKPDIVHLHNLHSNFINIEMLLEYLSKRDIPTVITMHDCWFFTGKCFHYIDSRCERFITGCGKCPKRMAPPASFLFDTSVKDWRVKKQLLNSIVRLAVVGCSKWIASEARRGFLKDHYITHIYNGVDTSVFRPKKTSLRNELGLPQNAFVILGMANKWTQKRNKTAFDAIVELENVYVVITGCSDKDKSFIEDGYKSKKNVICVGYISGREALSEYYNMADVFINLTHADTLPTVNMESICCGTPVITYDAGGSPELVDVNTGVVVEEDNVALLIEAINHVQQTSYRECALIGQQKFDKSVCYKQYLSIYRKLSKQ